MTECCGKISMSLVAPALRAALGAEGTLDQICSSGRPFSLLDVRVVSDATGRDVARGGGEVGEVWISGDTVFEGYHDNPQATAEAFVQEEDGADGDNANADADGGGQRRPRRWFKTGDLATVGRLGYLQICDRKKDMILSGSENVYSVEVERALQVS